MGESLKIFNRRKRLLINKKFQLPIIIGFSLLFFLVVIIFYIANLYLFKSMHNEAVQAGLSADNIFFKYLHNQKMLMDKIFLLTTIFTSALISFGGLYISSRIAGPLHRLTKHLKNSNVSDLKPVHFRKGDFFIDIQDAFNELIKK
jgi:uncharacterized protein (UPF0333 family)